MAAGSGVLGQSGCLMPRSASAAITSRRCAAAAIASGLIVALGGCASYPPGRDFPKSQSEAVRLGPDNFLVSPFAEALRSHSSDSGFSDTPGWCGWAAAAPGTHRAGATVARPAVLHLPLRRIGSVDRQCADARGAARRAGSNTHRRGRDSRCACCPASIGPRAMRAPFGKSPRARYESLLYGRAAGARSRGRPHPPMP